MSASPTLFQLFNVCCCVFQQCVVSLPHLHVLVSQPEFQFLPTFGNGRAKVPNVHLFPSQRLGVSGKVMLRFEALGSIQW